MAHAELILVAGSTGYVGRHLSPALLARGYRVRCLARQPQRIVSQPWFSQVEVVKGDVTHIPSLEQAMAGVSTAFYLVHNMVSGHRYTEHDLVSARNFAQVASQAELNHIIYLGGLADPDARIGGHLRSRLQTGDALRQGNVPVTEFRASIVIGPGGTAFELIRYLTEQFPLLPAPRWVTNLVQPISIHNVIDYLLAALETLPTSSRTYEIGGPQAITFTETMRTYACLRGLKRSMVKLPILPVSLMAFIADMLTPVPYSMANPLIDGMRGDSVVQDDAASRDFPQVRLIDYPMMVKDALCQLAPEHIDPLVFSGTRSATTIRHAGFLIDQRQLSLDLPPEAVYRAFTRLGGRGGWLYLNGLWRLRGWLDRLLGGPGMRGRVDKNQLEVGDALDFYTVEALQPGRLLRLRADLVAPGLGWMEWRAQPNEVGGVTLTQIAYFAPKGLAGFLYHYLLSPLHHLVYAGLIRRLARRAEELTGGNAGGE